MKKRTYIAIDLKSFYASVECRERGLDPLDTHLVVADEKRTDKTICLAVTPSLKSYGISGRSRLFEVRQRVREVNAARRNRAPGHALTGETHVFSELERDPSLAVDFIIAPPRMAYYMEYSTHIYSIYMKYVSPDDIVVYSIDEVFIDVTGYLDTYGLSARELAMKIVLDVLNTTGITATAGIGTNLFLCKVAMDIVAKHIPADENGVRIAALDEMKFRRELWSHRPITDFWRVGRGIAKRLADYGMYTMGDVALCSEKDEELLYKLFGKNAELLIDHAWGWEPCTVAAIKAYTPGAKSLSSGQVLQCPYEADKARLVLREMADLLALDLVDKRYVTDQIVITVGYDIENLTDPARRRRYHGPVEKLYVTFPNRAEYEKAYEAVRKLPVFLTDGGWAVDLEVMSRDTDKGVALRALAEKLGIAREQVLAMGDSGNDCAMLRYAGVGAAMGNAGEQAKKAADVIAPSNREDGVAWMLRRAARGEV